MTIDTELKPHESIPKADKPVLVCILDGWGENENKDKFNAIHSAETPVTDALKDVPGRWRTVRAHGTAVGLPSDADMGNSEVGHNALGTTTPLVPDLRLEIATVPPRSARTVKQGSPVMSIRRCCGCSDHVLRESQALAR
jgi:hypothetical protein